MGKRAGEWTKPANVWAGEQVGKRVNEWAGVHCIHLCVACVHGGPTGLGPKMCWRGVRRMVEGRDASEGPKTCRRGATHVVGGGDVWWEGDTRQWGRQVVWMGTREDGMRWSGSVGAGVHGRVGNVGGGSPHMGWHGSMLVGCVGTA